MRFGVLGLLEVFSDDGVPLLPSSPKQRALLAVLLCHPNQVVGTDRLVDLVWSGDPPKSARTNLQVYVHRLRQALGGSRILLKPPGYQLVVEPGELDADRFEELVAAGSPAEALRLWRGDAFAGLDDLDLLRAESARLHELRLVATEDRIEADLAAGQHLSLVPELTTLTARHPLRERIRHHLMLALHRSGRSVEAQEVYRETRQTLVDELGIEPGAALRQLAQAIREDDPALQLPADSPEPEQADQRPAVPVPAELPPASAIFTGRHTELATVIERFTDPRLESGLRIVAIVGQGGAGKSALAVQAAHAVAGAFPDGQLYVNLRGSTPGMAPLEPHQVLARFLRALGLTAAQIPAGVDEAAAAFRTRTVGSRLLVVLDNAADVSQVRPLLPGGTEVAVLVTSRAAQATLDSATQLHLGALSEDEAVVLFARLVGQDRVAAEPDAAAEIVQLCDRLPLAIRIAGARLAARPHWSPSMLAERLRDAQRRLDELEHADLALRAGIAVSRHGLTAEGGQLFDLLGALDLPDVGVPVAAALTDRTETQARRTLDELVEAQLLQPGPAERYSFHDLIRLYAKEQAARSAGSAAAVRRVIHHYVATARTAMRTFEPRNTVRRGRTGLEPEAVSRPGEVLTGPADAWTWIDAERANLAAAVGLAARDLVDGEAAAVALAAAIFPSFAARGHWAEAITANQALAAAAAERPGEFAEVHQDLGIAYQEVGQVRAGIDHIERLIAGARETGDRISEGTGLTVLGIAWLRLHEPEQAGRWLREARALFRELGDRGREAPVLNNLGSVALVAGRLDEAIEIYQECLVLYAELGDGRGEGIAMQNLGETLLRAGRAEEAVEVLSRALEYLQRHGLRSNEPTTLWALGDALRAVGEPAAARECWRDALAILQADGQLDASEVDAILAEPEPKKPLLRY